MLAIGHLGRARTAPGLTRQRVFAHVRRSFGSIVTNVAEQQQYSTSSLKRRGKREVKVKLPGRKIKTYTFLKTQLGVAERRCDVYGFAG